uniref:Endothelial differentiation related factor 1 n=16 Tax=Passeriformes TaxID=9126 RepID=A0A803VUJ4_FICAL
MAASRPVAPARGTGGGQRSGRMGGGRTEATGRRWQEKCRAGEARDAARIEVTARCFSQGNLFGKRSQQQDLSPGVPRLPAPLARLRRGVSGLYRLLRRRGGEDVETSKKWAAGQNKQHFITKNTAKLDRETEELHHDRVSLEVGKVIQQGRQSKGLTQKDLATKINEKPQVIADYESGRAIPNNQVMGKIERAIGLKLRGKDIGKPLETGPKGK